MINRRSDINLLLYVDVGKHYCNIQEWVKLKRVPLPHELVFLQYFPVKWNKQKALITVIYVKLLYDSELKNYSFESGWKWMNET